jgi:hypothetical protein
MCFHLLRVQPARRLLHAGITRERIEAHLADI